VIGVLVSGEGTNLQALLDEGLPVVAVASSRAGVRALERAGAADIEAAAFELEAYGSRAERDLALAAWLEKHSVELVVCAGFMQLLTPGFLERFPARIVNVHPSLLPEFPGRHAIEDALAAGVDTTGVTVHLVDEGIDSGPILAQEPVDIEPRATLMERIHAVEHRLLPSVVRDLLASWGADGKGDKPEARRTVQRGTDKRRGRSIVPPAAPGGGEAGLRPAGADADQGAECEP
jgi:phosphoribosylglycinamide formyltransferase-1